MNTATNSAYNPSSGALTATPFMGAAATGATAPVGATGNVSSPGIPNTGVTTGISTFASSSGFWWILPLLAAIVVIGWWISDRRSLLVR